MAILMNSGRLGVVAFYAVLLMMAVHSTVADRGARARSSSSVEGADKGRASAAVRSTGGVAEASATVKVAKVQYAKDAVTRSIAQAIDDVRRGRPADAVADAAATSIGEAVAYVYLQTQAAVKVKGQGQGAAHAKGTASAIAEVYVDAMAHALAEAANELNEADVDAVARATGRAVVSALAASESQVRAGSDSSARATNTVIASAFARPVALALAKALAKVSGNDATADGRSFADLDLNEVVDVSSVSDVDATGNGRGRASGTGDASADFVERGPAAVASRRGRHGGDRGGHSQNENGIRPQNFPVDNHFPVQLQEPIVGGQDAGHPTHVNPITSSHGLNFIPIRFLDPNAGESDELVPVPDEYVQYAQGEIADWVKELLLDLFSKSKHDGHRG